MHRGSGYFICCYLYEASDEHVYCILYLSTSKEEDPDHHYPSPCIEENDHNIQNEIEMLLLIQENDKLLHARKQHKNNQVG